MISSVPGVVDFKPRIGTSAEQYGESNIEIGIRQKAITSEGMVVIT